MDQLIVELSQHMTIKPGLKLDRIIAEKIYGYVTAIKCIKGKKVPSMLVNGVWERLPRYSEELLVV